MDLWNQQLTRWKSGMERTAATCRVHRERLTLWIGLVVILLANYSSGLLAHVRRSLDPSNFDGDVRQQIFPFFRYADPQLFRDDYIADYYLANFPIGYRALYTAAGYLGYAEQLSKLLPYLLLVIVIAGIGFTAYRLSGPIASATAVAIVLGCSLYLERMGGGLPRAFGYPIVALSMAALATGSVRFLVILTCVAAGFYPVAAALSGVTLAAWLLCLPSSARGVARHWGFGRRLGVVVFTLTCCVGALAPAAIGSSRYGGVITPDRVDEFPEIGPLGRYVATDRAPFPRLSTALRGVVDHSLFGTGTPWSRPVRGLVTFASAASTRKLHNAITEGLVLVSVVAWLLSVRRRPEVARLLMLPLAAVFGYVVASRVAPYLYLPQRYLNYAVPLCVALLVSTATGLVLSSSARVTARRSELLVGAVSLSLLLLVGGRGTRAAGVATSVNRSDPVLQAVAQLPPTSIVAAWPLGFADFVPYCAKRQIFAAEEVHQAFHVGYTLEMRRRVGALIDAYSADTTLPLIRLHSEFGVTHLVVRDEFVGNSSPRYFRPFDQQILLARERLGGRVPETQRHLDSAAVFRSNGVAILSLSEIAAGR